jgi:hypothetical protein
VGATGLSTSPAEYRSRLREQPDAQIDTWAAEAMRDISIRRGVRSVMHEFGTATGADERLLERIYTAGGGPAAVIGRDAEGTLMVPATTLYCLVPGARALLPDAREKLIAYLVENFEELVYT